MTQNYRPYPGAPGAPGLAVPAFQFEVVEGMTRELQLERTQIPQGVWVSNTIQPTWEVGRRWGLPGTVETGLNINGQDAYLPGPTEGRRWFVLSIWREGTTGVTYVIVQPKATNESRARLTVSGTTSSVVNLSYPGIIIENQGGSYDGGRIGMRDSSNAGDTSRSLALLYYETAM